MKKILLSIMALGLFTTSFAQVPKMIVLEEFTNASCSPCASQNPAYNTLLQANWTKVVSLKYQWYFPGYDPMNEQNPTEVDTRIGLYGINGVPTLAMNGRVPDNGNTTGGAWSGYAGGPYGMTQAVIDNEAMLMSDLDISISHVFNATLDSISVHVNVSNVSSTDFTSTAKLLLAMTEQEINYATAPGSNGETEFYEVMRKMYPNTSGTSLPATIVAGDSAIFDFNVEIPSYIYSLSEIAFVTFVQDLSTKLVYQGALSEPMTIVGPDGGITDITTLNSDYCQANISPTFTITNNGTVDLTAAEVTLDFNGTNSVETWSGTLTPGASANVAFSAQTLVDGINVWSATLSSVNGGGDISGGDNITAPMDQGKMPTSSSVSLMEDFESYSFGDDMWDNTLMTADGNNYVVDQNVSTSVTWGLGGHGNSEQSFRFKLFNMTAGQISSFVTYKYDLSATSANQFSFDYACAGLTDGFTDEIKVSVSVDCGATWTLVETVTGADLVTGPSNSGAYFYPQTTEWKTANVSLNAYNDESEVTVKFEVVGSSNGNCLYLDNVNLGGNPLSVTELENGMDMMLFPNPTVGNSTLSISSSDASVVTIQVVDIAGKNVMTLNNQSLVNGDNKIELATSNLENGVYFVEVSSDSKSSVVKLIIQK